MPNFVKISRQLKKSSIQGLDFDRTVCMAMVAISYSGGSDKLIASWRGKASVQNCIYTNVYTL